ncbi:MAG TPA: glycosyltransferase family A protein [Gemmatirosa sp.]|nr:glycosyltransferase family A protein [Gemmatirosa sp.]
MPPSTDAPLVSLVVPCFASTPHALALLDETLATVDAQSVAEREVLVVDDGSPLDVAAVAARHPRTRCLRRANGGSAQARNTGIAAARGAAVVFLDADDHLLPGALERGLAELEAHPGVEFVVGPREEMTFRGEPVSWGVPPAPVTDDLYRTLLAAEWWILPPSTAVFRRRVVEAVGGFRDPWGADDLDFYLRVAHRAAGRCRDGEPVTRYRRYAASTSRDGARMLRSVRTVFARQWPLVRGHAAREAAWHAGLARLEPIFRDCLAENVRDRWRAGARGRALRAALHLVREDPARLLAAAREALRPETPGAEGGGGAG